MDRDQLELINVKDLKPALKPTGYGTTNKAIRAEPSRANTVGSIDMCAMALMKRAAGDHGPIIYQEIREQVIKTVTESIAARKSNGYTQDDVRMAIGQALRDRLRI